MAGTPAGTVDVKAFGARGDGTTDDTLAVRAAITAGAGKIVFFPPGTYLMRPNPNSVTMQVVESGTLIVGIPGSSILKMGDGAMSLGNPGQLLGNVNTAGGRVDITVRGMTFDCNARGNPGALSAGFDASTFAPQCISIARLTNFVFDANQILDAKYAALTIAASSNSMFFNNLVYRSGQGYCDEVADKPCDTGADCTGSCVKPNGDGITVFGSTNTLVQGNQFINTGEGTFCQHSLSTPFAANRICNVVGNTVAYYDASEICTGSGKPFACCTGARTGNGAFGTVGNSLCVKGQALGSSLGILANFGTIVDNTIRNGNQISVQALAASTDFPTTDITVANNVSVGELAASGPGGCIILLANITSTTALKNITVRGNRCDTTEVAGVMLRSTNAAGTVTMEDVVVAENDLTKVCQNLVDCAGIYVDKLGAGALALNRLRISRNNLFDSPQDGVKMEGTLTDVVLMDNDLDTITGAKYNFTASASVFVSDFSSGLVFNDLNAASFATATNGSTVYCSDCTITNPCAGAGTGAIAKRLNGVWVCN
jgi:hypothetical protein